MCRGDAPFSSSACWELLCKQSFSVRGYLQNNGIGSYFLVICIRNHDFIHTCVLCSLGKHGKHSLIFFCASNKDNGKADVSFLGVILSLLIVQECVHTHAHPHRRPKKCLLWAWAHGLTIFLWLSHTTPPGFKRGLPCRPWEQGKKWIIAVGCACDMILIFENRCPATFILGVSYAAFDHWKEYKDVLWDRCVLIVCFALISSPKLWCMTVTANCQSVLSLDHSHDGRNANTALERGNAERWPDY